jgi:predicted Zn-dependent peptidase
MSLDHHIEHRTLANGISVVSVPLLNTEAVTLMVFMGVGSRFERDDQQGLAHFTEHMVFKGGVRYTSTREISEALEANSTRTPPTSTPFSTPRQVRRT